MKHQSASVPIRIRGRYLWRGDERFIVRGVAYQVRDTQNPIADDRLPELERDVALFKELGLNTVYVFTIDSTKPRARAMKLLEEAGLYILTEVTSRSCTINRCAPYESYNRSLLAGHFAAVDAMAAFPNTLGVFAASEVVNTKATLVVTPVIKAVVRDLKTYMELRSEVAGQRVLPVGYSAAGTAQDRIVFKYLTAGDKRGAIDFWAVVDFSSAPDERTAQRNWDKVATQYTSAHAPLPVIISQYGNNRPSPRTFQETTALYSPQTTRLLSGGCAYEFWYEANGYGLVELIPEGGSTRVRGDTAGKVAERRQTERGAILIFWDFVNYKARLAAVEDVKDIVEEGKELGINGDGGDNDDGIQGTWPWEPEGCEPESCVDWEQIRARMQNGV